jgi:hypothetical protein
VTDVAFHSKFFVSGGIDGVLNVLETGQGRPIQTHNAHGGPINRLSISGDGGYVATASGDGTVRVFDLRAGRQLVKFEGHKDVVRCVQFHPAEPLLVSCGADRSTRFWDLVQQREIPVSFPLDSACVEIALFSGSDSIVLSASTDYLKIMGWNPPELHDHFALNIEKLHDFAYADRNLTFASTCDDRVLIHRVGTDLLKPFCNREASDPNTRPRPATPRLLDLSAMSKKVLPQPARKPVTKRSQSAESPSETRLFDEYRLLRGPYMSSMNEKFSKLTRLNDMLDLYGLRRTLDQIAQNGDLGTEFLVMLRVKPDAVRLEHAGVVMQIAVRAFDQDRNLAIATVESMLQAFGKLVLATRAMAVPGVRVDPALEERKEQCELFVESFREITPRLRTVAMGNAASAQTAAELLEEWRLFLR